MKRAREQEVENVEPKKCQQEKLLRPLQSIVREYLEPYELAIIDAEPTFDHLIEAAHAGWLDGVSCFTGREIPTKYLNRALILAARNGHKEIINILKSECKELPIQSMCEDAMDNDNLEMVLWLLTLNPNVNLNPMLCYAIEANYPKVFRYCKDNGATANLADIEAVCALVERNDVKMLMELPELVGEVMEQAVEENKPDIMAYCLTKEQPTEEMMRRAIIIGHIDIVKMLIDRVAYSYMFVHSALSEKHNNILELLHNHYDLGCIDRIADAVLYSNEGAVRLMYGWGARSFQLAFDTACQLNRLEMIPVLWELGSRKITIDAAAPEILALCR